jgi:predicted permease
VVYRLMLAPLPFPDGDRLVSLVRTMQGGEMTVSPGTDELRAMRDGARSLEWLAGFTDTDVVVDGTIDPRIVHAVRIDPELPRLLSLPPVLGRTFSIEETAPNGPTVAILGHALWQSRFGGSPDVLGRSIAVDGVPHAIIGVMPRDFDLLDRGRWVGGELWLPLLRDDGQRGLSILAKLRSGVPLQTASSEAAAIGHALTAGTDEDKFSAVLLPAKGELADETRRMLVMLFGAVGVVLLIACANVASLLLARAVARAREIAVRTALGAGRGRIVRQMLTESMLLAGLGGIAGIAVAYWSLRVIVAVRPESLSMLAGVRIEPVVLAWTAGISLSTGVLFGLVPAIAGTGSFAGDALRGTRGSTGTGGARRFRSGLVVAEVALSVVLLVTAGLLVRTVRELGSKDLGFDPSGLVAARVMLPREAFPAPETRRAAMEQTVEAVSREPGVRAATLALDVPPQTGVMFGDLEIDGGPAPDGKGAMLAFNAVQPEYFGQMRMRIIEGRTFNRREEPNAALVSRSFAEHYWPRQSAVGRRVRIAGDEWSTVVGVVADVRSPGNTEEYFGSRQIYFPLTADRREAHLVLRPSAAVAGTFASIVRAAAGVHPAIRIREYRTLESDIAAGRARERFTMTLLSAFALIAVGLAGVGLYGVIAYGVAQRTRELGVRLAVGAEPAHVRRMVVWQGLELAAAGLALGIVGAAAAGRAIEASLYEVGSADPITYVAVVVALAGVAILASWAPARRAAAVDVVTALRGD